MEEAIHQELHRANESLVHALGRLELLLKIADAREMEELGPRLFLAEIMEDLSSAMKAIEEAYRRFD